MNLYESSIRMPVTTLARVFLVIVFGIACLSMLTVELKPTTDRPVLVVQTTWQGASPEEVEGQITNRYEQVINGVSNMLYTMSYSIFGNSTIIIFYAPGTNLDIAAAEVQRNLAGVQGLPRSVFPPQINKATDFVNLPVYQFSLTGPVSLVTMSTWADWVIVPRIKRLNGVGNCNYAGQRLREMRILFDQERLKSRKMTIPDLKAIIDEGNLNLSAGYFNEGRREWTVRTLGELLTEDDFRNMIISTPGTPVVKLMDVAEVRDTYQRPDNNCYIDGVRGLSFNVYNQVGANILSIIDLVDKEIGGLKKKYEPHGVKFTKIFDQSEYIRDAIRIVRESLLEAILLVLVALFVFLKNWRSIVIVAISIPVSIMGTFIGMWAFGYSVNVLSLAGLALAIGMIVDDAIVVLENIYRHRFEEGKKIGAACVDGTREVGMAAFMATLTTAAVFTPVLMLRSEIGVLFGAVAFVISFAVFVSLLDAFTVVPMLASRWMRESAQPAGVGKHFMLSLQYMDRIGAFFSVHILNSLKFFLQRRSRKFFLIIAVMACFSISLMILPGLDYLPTGGTDLIKMSLENPEGISLDEIDKIVMTAANRWSKMKGVRHVVASPSRIRHSNYVYLVCEKMEISGRTVEEIAREAYQKSLDLPFSAIRPIKFPLFGNIYSRSDLVDFRILGDDFRIMKDIVHKIMQIGATTPGVVFRYTDMALKNPEAHIRVDRERAYTFGFTVHDIANAVDAAVEGQRTTSQFDADNKYYYIRVMGLERQLETVSDLGKIILTSPYNRAQVPLNAVAQIETTVGPLQITHFNSVRSCNAQFTVDGRAMGDVFREVMNKIYGTIPFPLGYGFTPFGSATDLANLVDSLKFVFPLAISVIYLLLTIQFQSFVRPLSILLSAPLSIIGANVLVCLTGAQLNSFTLLGYLMMIGLVVKNAILLISYTVQLTDGGMGRDEALVLASERRMRPIFMTAIAMVLGMVPLALKKGAGAEIYNGLATAVIGGLSIGTLLTLVFVPVVYTVLDDLKNRLWKVRPLDMD